jgi:hypothetical protein
MLKNNSKIRIPGKSKLRNNNSLDMYVSVYRLQIPLKEEYNHILTLLIEVELFLLVQIKLITTQLTEAKKAKNLNLKNIH